jgi:hypothetical protein
MGDQQLKAWFDAIDVDHSGRLDSKELQRALAMGNLHYGLNDVVSTHNIVYHHIYVHLAVAARTGCQAVCSMHAQQLLLLLLLVLSHEHMQRTCGAVTLDHVIRSPLQHCYCTH